MQNLPKRTDKNIRKMFRSRWANGVIVRADESQAELRMLAEMSQDPVLVRAFKTGVDIHTYTAQQALGIKEVEDHIREQFKTVNYAVFYQAGARKIASEAGISVRRAADLMRAWFGAYKGAAAFIEEIKHFIWENNYITDIFGRRRILTILDVDSKASGHVIRQGVNFPFQVGVYNLLCIAILDLAEKFEKHRLRSRIVLQVHDEVVIDCHPSEKKIVTQLVRESMSNPPVRKWFGFDLTVPLRADVSWGPNWMEQEKL